MFREEILNSFKGKKLLVIGDFMLDEYIFGRVERISPEAPVPVVEAKDVTIKPGGAANVAANLASLGATPYVVGVVGKDEKGKKLKTFLREFGANIDWLVEDGNRLTTVKTRIVAGAQQLLRVDWENREYVSGAISEQILDILSKNYRKFDAIIISDYGKGVITPELFEITGKIREERPIILDPKEKNFPFYKDITAVTPNIKETFQAIGVRPETDEETEEAGNKLINQFNLEYAVITRSEKGLSIVGRNFKKHIPTRAKQVFDVTGAGDTVISVFSLALSAGATPVEAGEIANLAAGIVVGKLGTATTTVAEILEAYKTLRSSDALQNL